MKTLDVSNLAGVHDPRDCEGRGCPVHHPSDHHMVNWNIIWRADRGMAERICPTHGIGHPDPDQVTYWQIVAPDDWEWYTIHGCCGCCDGTPAFLGDGS